MQNRWMDSEAEACNDNQLALRVYTSRLLGQDPELVLHGGGNTSVKIQEEDFFGDPANLLYVKGSGWDLGKIEAPGFAPVRMETLLKLAELETLSDSDMVRMIRTGMTDPNAPNASVEAILHAVIPFTFVDHTHANAIIAMSNSPGGEDRIRSLYGDRMLIIPYFMPGFILARKVYELTRDTDWSKLEGMVLMNHGIFSFGDDAKTSYDRMIDLVAEAETYLDKNGAGRSYATGKAEEDLLGLANVRRAVSNVRGFPVIAIANQDPESVGYASLEQIDTLATRGPLTPDHTIRTKCVPVVIGDDAAQATDAYAEAYAAYFERNKTEETMLDPAPRWAVWKNRGTIAFGDQVKAAGIIQDVVHHTIRTIQQAEALGGWEALPEKDLFDVEYWELEQAKLKKAGARKTFQGQIALVTGAASGIGRACAEALRAEGAAVVATDINPEVESLFRGADAIGVTCDMANEESVIRSVESAVRHFGGLDIVVSNAGIFPAGEQIESLDFEKWEQSLRVNATGSAYLLKHAIPYLKRGIRPTIILNASRNVLAPGPGAAAYSAPKAALTQLGRVAALELAPFGIRVNIFHGDAIFDTGLWTEDTLSRAAERYDMSVDNYKRKNLMKTELSSADVARLVCALAGPAFAKTTGAQIPIDGGNDRVI